MSGTGGAPRPFALTGELPVGTVVLEASAGTGKTYTIAGLVARYLAEGHAELDELMIVTFGRMATDELRARVRTRLVAVESALGSAIANGTPVADDPVHVLLTTAPTAELQVRRERIQRALAEFDAATIATTHEFCSRMLDGLGVLGNAEHDAVFTEHLGDLTAEVARDVYLRRYAATGRTPFPFRARPGDTGTEDAVRIAERVVGSGHADLVPALPAETPDPVPNWAERVAYAVEVRREVERRKRRSRLFSYDDMLTRLYDALCDERTGALAADRLRQRYRVVLVDEFQDTDVLQWEILRRAFHRHRTLILIGDPKQAIYAFRGADVYSYLAALEVADEVATLDTNWRSDQVLVEELQALLGGAALGDGRIVVRPVAAAHTGRRLSAAAGGAGDGPAGRAGAAEDLTAPLRIRAVPPNPPDQDRARVGPLRETIKRDLVADVTRLLAARPWLRLDPDQGARELRPSDIAVLVRKNSSGEVITKALIEAGVPATLLGSSSVFAAEVAADWLTLLTALEQPRLFRAAACTCFVGWSITELADADDDALTGLAQRIRSWSRALSERGVAALLELATAETRLSERLLARTDGERVLTDLRHIGQALHATMTRDRLGVGALVEWLREQIARARIDAGTDLSRRLETDAEAVQVLTVHRSKGLQFPVVYLPEAWDAFTADADEGHVLRLHEQLGEGSVGDCVLDVGGAYGPGRDERWQQYRREESGEDLRLLYVGLTRAQCAVVTWWADSARNTVGSPLHRVLFRDLEADSAEPKPTYPVPPDPIGALRMRGCGRIEMVEPRSPVPAVRPPAGPDERRVRVFARDLDLDWRRTSYSSLTAAAHGLAVAAPAVGSEVELAWEDDEVADPGLVPAATGSSAAAAPVTGLDRISPMQDLPSGVLFGTAVHAVLEHVDPTVADLRAELRRVVGGIVTAGQPGELAIDVLTDALLLAMQTPLGSLADDRRLIDIAPSDRLAELDFELPLAGGDTRGEARRECRLGDLVPLLREWLPAGDPLTDYPDLLAHPTLAGQSLRGYLTGSIDAVLRIGSRADPRYLVVDYKTNWLGSVEGPQLRLGDYTPDRMATAMMAAHYPLQALLYGVAVHRMLRWRQPGYDPARQLGGVLYLFVRGMAGADTPRLEVPGLGAVPCGVFSWRPAPELVTACSDLLDRGVSR